MNREHEYYKEALRGLMPDFETVRRQAKEPHSRAKPDVSRKQVWPRWLVSAVVAAAALCVVVFCVPPVRASLVDLFWNGSGDSTAAYVSTPAYERPEVENVEVQQVAAANWKLHTFAGKDFSWGPEIRAAEVEEALYDSAAEELTVKYTVDGAAFGLYGDALRERFGTPEQGDGAVPSVKEAVLVLDPEAVAEAEAALEDERDMPWEHVAPLGLGSVVNTVNGIVTATCTYKVAPAAAGGELTLLIPCATTILSEGGRHALFDGLGVLEVPFQVDVDGVPGKEPQVGTYDVGGKQVEITQAALTPTALRIRFTLRAEDFPSDLDFDIYADGVLLTEGVGADRVSCLDYLMGSGSDGTGSSPVMEGLLRVPFADNSISQVELQAVSRETGQPLSDDTIVLTFS